MPLERIAFITVHTSPLAPMGGAKTGGMNVYISELARELGRLGIQVDIFTRRSSPYEPEIDYALGDNARVIYLKAGPAQALSPEQHVPHLSEFTASLIAFATLQNLRYGLVYSHYWLSGWVAAKLKEAWGIRFVHMYHTLGLMKQRIEETALNQPDQRVLIEMQVQQAAARIIAATPAEQAQLRWLYRAPRRQIIVIPPGVDPERFQQSDSRSAARAALRLKTETELLLFVGRIEPLKAVDTILEALHALRERKPDLLRRLHFMIVGGDPRDRSNREMTRLQSLSVKLGIDQLVSFVGAKEQAQLPRYYRAATAVIMPSDYESFGMVALEAMSSGTPVIASQVGGLQFLVRDRETGYHIPTREPISLADCIIELLSDSARAELMGESAARLAQDYAWSRIAQRLLRVFETVSGQARKQP
ncbi:MAG: glycosyltransferase [Chloroflexi bacterium]|nr:glycosyltransferase [Chloroflexota bacterium]MCY3581170.1 glycosyltransferase [Chloroflexota bacterium]MCY3717233.1 glycosyltransferase [Chloroflexota bacterium]MDE2651427.1 glycosyltransferase [Chloroflexota bacterium]MXX52239.1 glycosyltransferase family 1 protein [Chloroflexota bacterium]